MHRIAFLFKVFIESVRRDGFIYSIDKSKSFIKNYGRKKIFLNSKLRKGKFEPVWHDPLVSVIVVNFNGVKFLHGFLTSLAAQIYQNFELIFVDNGSSDNSLSIFESVNKPYDYKILKNNNVGFAAGCNIGARAARGELVAFVNADTILDCHWLKCLVDALRFDLNAAAATSKTLFLENFFEFRIDSHADFKIDLRTLEQSLCYPKYFIRSKHRIESDKIICGKCLVVSLPASTLQLGLKFQFEDQRKKLIKIKIGKQQEVFIHCDQSTLSHTLQFPKVFDTTPVINNAGSGILNGDQPYDRGFGEYDYGQYDKVEYVDRLCGCSFIFRQVALTRREPFVGEFFAYYEDSELSRHIVDAGYKIVYTPRSVLRHYHSATSVEKSQFWNYLVSRSSSIYAQNITLDERCRRLNKAIEQFGSGVPADLNSLFEIYDQRILDRQKRFGSIQPKVKAIGVYNSFWNSFGGGESHALNVAKDFINNGDKVFFLSETDFDLERLFDYFGISPVLGCKYVGRVTERLTEQFDIFINSTYCSNLSSRAKNSFYVVSFPHKHVTRAVKSSYVFLYNSLYTMQWAEKYWGKVRGVVRLPLDSINENDIPAADKKEKCFVVVGRYCTAGHKKMQLEIANALQKAIENTASQDWQLLMFGSLDHNDADAVNYFESIQMLSTLNPEIKAYANVERSKILDAIERASYIISATGLNERTEEPELFEHFGIAVLEGLAFGCAPIVHSVGGPAELASKSGQAMLFNTEEELVNCLETAMTSKLPDPRLIQSNIISYIRQEKASYANYAYDLN